MKEYKPMKNVLLSLARAQNIPDGLRKYDQMIFKVSKVTRLRARNNQPIYWTYYELKGCESEKGVPYAIPTDWLYDAESCR